MGIGSWIGSAASGVASGLATPIANAWAETKKSQAAIHTIDKQTDRDITVASFTADVQFAQAQRLLNAADSSHWSTRWIRPAFAGLSFVYYVMALKGWLPATPLPPAVEYVLAGIPGAIFLLRPLEKNKRADIAAKAQVQPVPRSAVAKLLNRRADDP